MKRDADDYVLHSLQDMQTEVEKITNQVKNGILTIENSKKSPDQAK